MGLVSVPLQYLQCVHNLFTNLYSSVHNLFTTCSQFVYKFSELFTKCSVCIQMFTICLQNVQSLYTNVHNLFTKCSQSVYNMLKVKHSFSLLYFGRGAHKVHFVIL